MKPLIVLYALRYALPRVSGALSDVVPVLREVWPEMDEGLRQAARRDVQEAWDVHPGTALHAPEKALMADLLDFMDDNPGRPTAEARTGRDGRS